MSRIQFVLSLPFSVDAVIVEPSIDSDGISSMEIRDTIALRDGGGSCDGDAPDLVPLFPEQGIIGQPARLVVPFFPRPRV